MQTLTLKRQEPIHTYANHLSFVPKKSTFEPFTGIIEMELDEFHDKLDQQRQSAFDEDNWQQFMNASKNDKVQPAYVQISHPMTEQECESRMWDGCIQKGVY